MSLSENATAGRLDIVDTTLYTTILDACQQGTECKRAHVCKACRGQFAIGQLQTHYRLLNRPLLRLFGKTIYVIILVKLLLTISYMTLTMVSGSVLLETILHRFHQIIFLRSLILKLLPMNLRGRSVLIVRSVLFSCLHFKTLSGR